MLSKPKVFCATNESFLNTLEIAFGHKEAKNEDVTQFVLKTSTRVPKWAKLAKLLFC